MLPAIAAFIKLIALFLVTAMIIVVGRALGADLTDMQRHLIGYLGTGWILLAQIYVLRKKLPALAWLGSIKDWMGRHRVLTLFGAALIIVHAGGGEPPRGLALWSLILMLATVLSGLVGAYIHMRAIKAKAHLRAEFKQRGLSEREIEDELYLVTLTESTFRYWKKIHLPITLSFFITLGLHVAAMIFFGGVLHG